MKDMKSGYGGGMSYGKDSMEPTGSMTRPSTQKLPPMTAKYSGGKCPGCA